MKLELKHLAPYLPYGIEAIIIDDFGKRKDFVKGIDIICDCLVLDEVGDWYYNDDENEFNLYPLLRPLSDLKNEIEHKGERFTPIKYLDSVLTPVDFFEDTDHYDYLINWMNSTNKSHHIQFLPYGLINQLLEWHFDVFDLIKNGLAIDINTIKTK